MDMVQKILKGDKRSIARLITLIENQAEEVRELLKQLHKFTGKAITIGITGPPGAGKSSIVNFLAKKFREDNKKVGIIAIDPTSPFTGGAILGDRIRMQDLTLDEGIYIYEVWEAVEPWGGFHELPMMLLKFWMQQVWITLS